ncbi:FAD/NAD-P-binding domain-containing protein [Multifurca ochricompacta]|uniref:FAD/NAD-P-binding domain-containing protein n=1 Tax=Multifurca ochricompacta TaxID=376703 RepID=A0AAD4QM42_9AGAM|nr:FAD/NAD-P-binding domain-containing protein [Multifurca ochricompacta]
MLHHLDTSAPEMNCRQNTKGNGKREPSSSLSYSIMTTTKPSSSFNIAIIGSGFGGLSVAIALKRKWGFNDFVIYESGAGVGGTWRDNTYPGCACDVPVHYYSLSTDPKPDWARSHATQPEILEYIQRVADKYHLHQHCRFHTSVDKAEWDADANVWVIETRDVRTGEKQVSRATALVSAIGILVVPRYPKLQGIELFEGEVFHSARWRHDVDLHGKRVGVVGNGSSATQFVPIISEDPTIKVTNFVRTAMWYIPSPHIPYWGITKWAFAYLPLVRLIHRFWIAATVGLSLITLRSESDESQYEMAYLMFKGKGNNFLAKLYSKSSEKYIKDVVPAKYHSQIIPTYPIGCRRIVRDLSYLQSLNRSNVRLTFDHIARVEPDGVVTETGEKVPLDVIIYGTGFITDNYPLDVRGTRGTLKEYNDAHGGPMAYLGSTVPGFPNFFMIQGPNVTTGHTSALFSEESQTLYLLKFLAPIRSGLLTSIAPTDVATEQYNDMLQERLENSVWTQCASWYRVGSRGRIFSTFPGPLALLWWWLRNFRWEDHEVRGPGARQWRRRHGRSRKALFATVTLIGALGALGSAVFLKGGDPEEVIKQAVRVLPPRFFVVLILALMQRDISRDVWNRLRELLPA